MPLSADRHLTWTERWPPRFEDFVGRDSGNRDMLARVFALHHGPFASTWFWTVADGRELGKGYAGSRAAAETAAEAAYFDRRPAASPARLV